MVLKGNYDDLVIAFQCLENIKDKLMTYICDNSLDNKLADEAQQYMLDIEKTKNEARVDIYNIEHATDKPKIKVKAFDSPRFGGNMRDYPSFKEDFDNLVSSV